MIKILSPDTSKFHNFKCGEIYCVSSNNYNVACCLCGTNVVFERFPQHFQTEHLKPKLEEERKSKNAVTATTTGACTVKTDLDPIKSEEEYLSDNGGDSVGFDAADSDREADAGVAEAVGDEKPFDFVDLLALKIEIEPEAKPKRRRKAAAIEKDKFKEIDSSDDDNDNANDNNQSIDDNGDNKDDDWRPDDSSGDEKKKKPQDIDSLPYPCPDCMRSYKSKRAMQIHHRQRHNPTKREKKPELNLKFKCDDCGELFKAERNLRAHRYKHTGIICDVCGKKFSQAGNLARHKIRHTGIKAHKCQECEKDFFTDKELKAHMLRHTGERPVVCEICGRRCRDHGVYKAHMRRHTGERPAKCDVCGKAFYSFHDLNVHAVTHRPERPFACDMCGSTFQRKKSLRVHKKLHSKDRKHECKVCGKAFTQSGGLNAHMRTHDAALSRSIVGTNSTIPIPVVIDIVSAAGGNSIVGAGTSSGSALGQQLQSLGAAAVVGGNASTAVLNPVSDVNAIDDSLMGVSVLSGSVMSMDSVNN